MSGRIYIAGPMESAGGNWNFPLFDYIAEGLRDAGYEVFSPADHARQELGKLEDILALGKAGMRDARRQLMQDELNWICMYAQLVIMLPGWQHSPGATAEHAVTLALGKSIYELATVMLPSGEKEKFKPNTKLIEFIKGTEDGYDQRA